MKSITALPALFITICLLLQGCSGTLIKVGVENGFNRSDYDMEKPMKISQSASGFQLFLFIPISVNSRHARAYEELERRAGGGLISDVSVQESWQYAFVGTVYTTTIEATVYPRKVAQ